MIQAAAYKRRWKRKGKGLKEDFGWALQWGGRWAVSSRMEEKSSEISISSKVILGKRSREDFYWKR